MNSFEICDLLNLLGVMLNLENLKLNDQQSRALMEEMYGNQDKMLKIIIQQNEILIDQNNKLLKFMEEK